MLSPYEDIFAGLVSEILQNGERRETRNGFTLGIFARSFRVSSQDIPLLSGRKLYYKGVLGELAAMFRGPKHIDDFKVFGCNYWDDWGDDDGKLNVDYGNSWIDYNGYNQLAALKDSLTNDPMGRRHIISGWRPDKLAELSLPCCHMLYQWYVTIDGRLDMIWYQRSVDVMIGLPADVILATAWNQLLANELGLTPGAVNFMLADCHIYEPHIEGAHKYMSNVTEIGEWEHKYMPSKLTLKLNPGGKTENFLPHEFTEEHYDPMDPIKFELLV